VKLLQSQKHNNVIVFIKLHKM